MFKKAVLLLIFFLSLYLVFSVPRKVTITITSSGFQPNEVTISPNTLVEFVNQDSVNHWPASDLHPLHTQYPEFDPQNPINPGEKWSLKIVRGGKWGYHDHLNPHQKGVLVVSGEKTKAEKPTNTASSFTEDPNWPSWGEKDQLTYLQKLAKNQGSETAWGAVVKEYSSKSVGFVSVHDLAHLVGTLVFEEKGLEGLQICSPAFAFGCYHGFSEAAFQQSLQVLPSLEKSCQEVGLINSGPYLSCIHGLGHGLATFYSVKDLAGSLKACEKLKDAPSNCFDGVFMEFATSASKDFYQEPLSPCLSLEQSYLFSCGRSLPTTLEKYFQKDLVGIDQTCTQARGLVKEGCLQALYLLVGQRSTGSSEKIVGSCLSLGEKVECITKASGEIIFQNYQNWPEEAFKSCSTLDEKDEKNCLAYLDQVKKDYGR